MRGTVFHVIREYVTEQRMQGTALHFGALIAESVSRSQDRPGTSGNFATCEKPASLRW